MDGRAVGACADDYEPGCVRHRLLASAQTRLCARAQRPRTRNPSRRVRRWLARARASPVFAARSPRRCAFLRAYGAARIDDADCRTVARNGPTARGMDMGAAEACAVAAWTAGQDTRVFPVLARADLTAHCLAAARGGVVGMACTRAVPGGAAAPMGAFA